MKQSNAYMPINFTHKLDLNIMIYKTIFQNMISAN